MSSGFYFPPQPAGVNSVFGRVGNVIAQPGDYDASQVTNAVSTTGSYSNPSWITSLDYSKITGAPTIYYQLAQINGGINLPQRPRFNFVAGPYMSISGADDISENRTNITIDSSGLSQLNGLSAVVQTLNTGTSGTDFNIVSSGSVHTFNIPNASATARGLVTSSDWSTFNAKEPGIPTAPVTAYFRGDKTWQEFSSYENYVLPSHIQLQAVQVSTAANRIHIRRFTLTQPWLIRTARIWVQTAAASSTIGFGIYSVLGTRLYHTGALDSSTTGEKSFDLGSILVLQPGNYLFAWAASSTTVQSIGVPHNALNISAAGAITPYIVASESFGGSGMPATINTSLFSADTVSTTFQTNMTSY